MKCRESIRANRHYCPLLKIKLLNKKIDPLSVRALKFLAGRLGWVDHLTVDTMIVGFLLCSLG
jgi:hypothetical protein